MKIEKQKLKWKGKASLPVLPASSNPFRGMKGIRRPHPRRVKTDTRTELTNLKREEKRDTKVSQTFFIAHITTTVKSWDSAVETDQDFRN